MNRLTLNNIGQIQLQLDTYGLDCAGPVQERIQCAQPSSRSWHRPGCVLPAATVRSEP